MLLALPPADHLLIERDRGQFRAFSRRRVMANVGVERLLKIPAEPSPELRIPRAAAQTRVVSVAGIRLRPWESARAFKGISCDDISELPRSPVSVGHMLKHERISWSPFYGGDFLATNAGTSRNNNAPAKRFPFRKNLSSVCKPMPKD